MMFGPKHTAVAAARIILAGLRDGSIIVGDEADSLTSPPLPLQKPRKPGNFNLAYLSAATIAVLTLATLVTTYLSLSNYPVLNQQILARIQASPILENDNFMVIRQREWASAGLNESIEKAKAEFPKTLPEFAEMDDRSFAASLPQFRRAVEKNKQSISPTVTSLIVAKLRKISPQNPDYWPSTLHFLQLASASPSLLASPPRHVIYLTGFNTAIIGSYIENVTLVVDGGLLKTNSFHNSLIIFVGRPATFENVHFYNCAFLFQSNFNDPPPLAKEAAQQLLASNGLGQVTLNLCCGG
jgi:hypothetical protein